MTRPDGHFAEDGNNVKWTLFYDEKFERQNPFVFSRLNGTWPGAPVTQWDFSRYAAGVKDRRLNFLPPYPNGIVLITPEQQGRETHLRSMLHPLYRDILKEYVTDGRHYYSQDGKKKLAADTFYRWVEQDIAKSAAKIPLTVSGNVAWVSAASSPKHIRLTLVDGIGQPAIGVCTDGSANDSGRTLETGGGGPSGVLPLGILSRVRRADIGQEAAEHWRLRE
jgi:hypothetical protein